MVAVRFLPLNVAFSSELMVSEPLHLSELISVLLAYYIDVSWLVALSSMFIVVNRIFHGWIQ